MTTVQITSDRLAARRDRATCTAGLRLQAAREAAGITRDQLSRRAEFAGSNGWGCARQTDHDCNADHSDVRHGYVRKLERMSQRVFYAGVIEHGSRWDGVLWEDMHWTRLMTLVELGSPDATDAELADAWHAHLLEQYHRDYRDLKREVAQSVAALPEAIADMETLLDISLTAGRLRGVADRVREVEKRISIN